MMVSKPTRNNDEQAVAKLLWQLKAIATKEVEKVNLPYSCIDSFFIDSYPMNFSEGRGRTVSVESADIAINNTVTPVLSSIPRALLLDSAEENSIDHHIDHHDWGPLAENPISPPSLISTDEGAKKSKKKRESRVGLTTKSGIVRSTLRKKVSRVIIMLCCLSRVESSI